MHKYIAGRPIVGRPVGTVPRLFMVIAFLVSNVQGAPPGEQRTKESQPTFALPSWSADARWYEIDLPRFHNGDTGNDLPRTTPWTWEEPPPPIASGSAPLRRNFGGDLAGIVERLPYLKSLGVNTLYLGTVFHGASDTPPRPTDMRHIDDVFGTARARTKKIIARLDIDHWTVTNSDRLFFEFLKTTHDAGFRVVAKLDTGFRRRRGNKRIYQDVTATPYLRAIAKRWSDPNDDGNPADGVDGWVVTPASGERDGAVETFALAVREINPEALFVRRGDVPSEVKALGLPAWSENLVVAFANTFQPGARAAPRIGRLFPTATGRSGNLSGLPAFGIPVGFQNTDRAVTQCATAAEAQAMPDEQAYARYRLTMLAQYFLPGTPVTECGNEVGIFGGESNSSRAPMWWTDLEAPDATPPHYRDDILWTFRWLNKFRKAHPVLSRGTFRAILLDQEKRILSFARTSDNGEIGLAVNYGSTRQVTRLKIGTPGHRVTVLSPQWQEMPFSVPEAKHPCDDDGFVSIGIEPMSGAILLAPAPTTNP